jgi:hypothetical protein
MLELHADLTNAEVGATSPPVIRIWVEVDGRCYPERGWWDFSVILKWWRESISSNSRDFVLRFMDGPYTVACRVEEGVYRVRFLRDGVVESSVLCSVDPSGLLGRISEIETAVSAMVGR